MTQEEFYSSISDPLHLSASVVENLEHEITEHPYFEAGWMLMLKGMSDIGITNYDASLHKGAICISNRSALFNLIQSKPDITEQIAETVEREREKPTEDIVSWSMGDYEFDFSAEAQSNGNNGIYSIEDITKQVSEKDNCGFSDWLDYMDKQPSMPNKKAEVPKDDRRKNTRSRSLDLIESFLSSDKAESIIPRSVTNSVPHTEAQQKTDTQHEETQLNADNDDILTETLARIYIKQGQFDKAINIFRKLGLKYPEKSSYFASRINELENK